jgi:hypothetical protein
MSNNEKQPENTNQQGTLSGTSYEAEDVFEGAEPWDPIETKIVLGSFAAALVCLAIFAYLINKFLLNH